MSRRKRGQKCGMYDPGTTAEALIETILADLEEAQKKEDKEKIRKLRAELEYWMNRLDESGRHGPPMGIARKPLPGKRKGPGRAKAAGTRLTAEQLERARSVAARLTQPEQIEKIIHEVEKKMGIIVH